MRLMPTPMKERLMTYKVIYTKLFNSYLRGLEKQGQKKVVSAARVAIAEAGMNGDYSFTTTHEAR